MRIGKKEVLDCLTKPRPTAGTGGKSLTNFRCLKSVVLKGIKNGNTSRISLWLNLLGEGEEI